MRTFNSFLAGRTKPIAKVILRILVYKVRLYKGPELDLRTVFAESPGKPRCFINQPGWFDRGVGCAAANYEKPGLRELV